MALLVRLDRLDQWDPQVHQETESRHRALLELLDFLAKMALQDTPELPAKTDLMEHPDLRDPKVSVELMAVPDLPEHPEPPEQLAEMQDHQDFPELPV